VVVTNDITALREVQDAREKPLRLSDVKRMFILMNSKV
jgi:hypothetical protein